MDIFTIVVSAFFLIIGWKILSSIIRGVLGISLLLFSVGLGAYVFNSGHAILQLSQ